MLGAVDHLYGGQDMFYDDYARFSPPMEMDGLDYDDEYDDEEDEQM